MNYLDTKFWNNPMSQWLTAAAILIVSLLAMVLLKRHLVKLLQKWASNTTTHVDDIIIRAVERLINPVFIICGLYFSFSVLHLDKKASQIIHGALLLIITYYVLKIFTTAFKQFVFFFIRKQENSELKEKQAKGLILIVNIVIWILGIIFTIDNLGYDVTTLIAGLGIGGIAIALAAQAILGDLFSYFVIFFDRPFEIGDFIIVDDKMGVVEYIGIKTTRLRTLGGEQLVCSNTDLTNSRVHNYKRMARRRVVFKLGVIYQTSNELVKKIPGIVKSIITSVEKTTFDRGHFSGFGDSSLDFEFVYYIEDADYNKYMDIHQSILLDILQHFETQGIQFAYPTQTLFIQPDQQ